MCGEFVTERSHVGCQLYYLIIDHSLKINFKILFSVELKSFRNLFRPSFRSPEIFFWQSAIPTPVPIAVLSLSPFFVLRARRFPPKPLATVTDRPDAAARAWPTAAANRVLGYEQGIGEEKRKS